MGLGHVIRSLAYLNILKTEYQCFFIIKEPLEKLKKEILKYCNNLIEIALNASIDEEIDLIGSKIQEQDIIILDGYHFETSYQRNIKNLNCTLVCIDDIYSYHFISDLVINHAPLINKRNYSCDFNTTLKTGLKYALLREPFLKKRAQPRVINEIRNCFICFGGSDFNNLTFKALQAIVSSKHDFNEIHIVIGLAYKHKSMLESFINIEDLNCQLYSNLSDVEMREVMDKCQLAIVPCSSILYEACSVQMLIITGFFVDNQVHVEKGFRELELVHSVGDFNVCTNLHDIIDKVVDFNDNKQILNQHNSFNGASKLNLLKCISSLVYNQYEMRNALFTDVDLYFNWANDPIVRKSAINQDKIVYEEHCKWFTSKLNANNTFMYVLQNNFQKPVGQIRFDIKNKNAIISYSIEDSFRGKGMATVLVKKGMLELREELSFESLYYIAWVKVDNPASIKVFENIGYEFTEEKLYNNELYNIYSFDMNLIAKNEISRI